MQLACGFQLENVEVAVSILEQMFLHHDYGLDCPFTGWVLLTSRHVSSSAASFHAFAHPQTLYEKCKSIPGLSLCTTPKQTRMFMTMCTWSCSELRGTCIYLASLSFFGCECVCIHSEGNNHSTQLLSHSFFHLLVFRISIMRRIFSLINQVAVTVEDSKRLQSQMDTAVEAAKQREDENQLLKRVSRGQRQPSNYSLWVPVTIHAVCCEPQALLEEEKAMTINNQHLKLEVEKWRNQVKAADEGEGFPHRSHITRGNLFLKYYWSTSSCRVFLVLSQTETLRPDVCVSAAVHRSKAEVEAMKKQAKGLAQEYDRLLTEHHQLQVTHTHARAHARVHTPLECSNTYMEVVPQNLYSDADKKDQ